MFQLFGISLTTLLLLSSSSTTNYVLASSIEDALKVPSQPLRTVSSTPNIITRKPVYIETATPKDPYSEITNNNNNNNVINLQPLKSENIDVFDLISSSIDRCAKDESFAIIPYNQMQAGVQNVLCLNCIELDQLIKKEKHDMFDNGRLAQGCQTASDCDLGWASLRIMGDCGRPVIKANKPLVEQWATFYNNQFINNPEDLHNKDDRQYQLYQRECGIVMPGCMHSRIFDCVNNRCMEKSKDSLYTVHVPKLKDTVELNDDTTHNTVVDAE